MQSCNSDCSLFSFPDISLTGSYYRSTHVSLSRISSVEQYVFMTEKQVLSFLLITIWTAFNW